MMWYWMNGYGWGGLFMMIFYILLFVLAIYILIRFISDEKKSQYKSAIEDRKIEPIDILKERYAKGEIGDEEYERMKEKLRK